MIDNKTCKVRGVIVPTGDEEGTHYTFSKKGNQWYYHPPGEPGNWIPCTDEEAKYLDRLVQEIEREYARKVGMCSGESKAPPIPPPPPPIGGKKRQAC